VAADVTGLTLQLRALATTPSSPLVVDLLVNNRLANQIRFSDSSWQTIDLPLGRRQPVTSTQIELRAARTWVPAEVIPGNADTRRLGVQVGEPILRR